MFAALRLQNARSTHLLRPLARRYLATEVALPKTVSPEFAREAAKSGKDLIKPEPELSEEEQKARYNAFLEEKALEKPLRPHLNVKVDPNHGLWAFFRKLTRDGKEIYETVERNDLVGASGSGRSWNAFELRRKSFKDLHTLWYIVLRERNLLATQRAEAMRLGIPLPATSYVVKEKMCRKTMARIKQVLNERRLAYEKAVAMRFEQTSEKISEPTKVSDQTSRPQSRGRRRRRVNSAAVFRANSLEDVPTPGRSKEEAKKAAEAPLESIGPEPPVGPEAVVEAKA